MIAAREVVEVSGVEAEVSDTLHDPRHGEGSISGSCPCGPRRRDDERHEQDANVSHEVFVVRAAGGCDPASAEREVLEEGSREQRGLDTHRQHEQRDQHQWPVRSPTGPARGFGAPHRSLAPSSPSASTVRSRWTGDPDPVGIVSSGPVACRDLLLDIDRTRKQRSLEAGLRAAIRAGRLKPGEAVPSSRGLAADLELARATVVAAYDQLVAEGYLAARHRRADACRGRAVDRRAARWRTFSPGLPARSDPWRARLRPIPACGVAALHTRGVGDRSQRFARLRRPLRAGRTPSCDRELPEPHAQRGGDRRLDDRGPRRR